ncbi:MAG TPA: bifunctional tetrahydrofolate synthase/dihydrofolate synthase [Gammaproteobacteria bacterium]|nr:bifunctional tetrahydrofolate synthase/dihydrofolate synthase [Gammaproteobacteria bacterium]
MRFDTLSQWLDWQSSLHPTAINLGLDRVSAVAARMAPRPATTRVITVGGTNGKGSCVGYLEAILQAAGYRVGAYTSPHLEHYSERVRINGREADDATLCEAFQRVDDARGNTSLTYFEFGTLAALDIFWREALDVAVLEVGLGGRLDAVNIVDADCAVVTHVALDHVEWLGPDRESIGREKAGIFRAGTPALCADRDPPTSLLEHAYAIGADLQLIGRDFDWRSEESPRAAGAAPLPGWTGKGGDSAKPLALPFAREAGKGELEGDSSLWRFGGRGANLDHLPPPAMPGAHQLDNAAAALAALQALSKSLPVEPEATRAGIAAAKLPGRFETLPGEPATILDVAHNPDAARVLAGALDHTRGAGRTLAVLGMMRDKAVEDVIAALAPQVNRWYLAGLTDLAGPRGLEAEALRDRVAAALAPADCELAATPWQAWQQASAAAQSGDRIVVCGSFVTVADVRENWFARRGRAAAEH